MLLQQKDDFKSIKALPDVELPDFAVITGVNGVGKSHLLEGLEKGSLTLTGCSKETGIQYFTIQSLLSQFEVRSSTAVHPRKTRKEALHALKQRITQQTKQLSAWFSQRGFHDDSRLTDGPWLAKASVKELEECVASVSEKSATGRVPSNWSASVRTFLSQRSALEQNLKAHLHQFPGLSELVDDYAARHEKSVLALSAQEAEAIVPLFWNPVDGVRVRFSEWFRAYFSEWERNRMYRYYSERHEENHHWLTDEAFNATFGPPPWEIANDVLEKCGATYRFDPPRPTFGEEDAVTVSVPDVQNSSAKYGISDLSMGERTLLGVISLLYRATPAKSLSRLPKVLLLDEIDGPLHPAYTKPLMSVLEDTLVKQCGIKVILVTHSPSTVAFAPEHSIFELRKEPRGLIPVSRAQAINTLTAGFISVLPSSRVIITESTFDADVYSKYYNALVRHNCVQSEPPLTFLPASKRNSNDGGGKNDVEKWAVKLSEFFSELGFLGIIDRDDSNIGKGPIHVIERHSLENYVLDPLALIAVLIKDGVSGCWSNNPIPDMNFARLVSLSARDLQSLIDDLCAFIEKSHPPFQNAERVAAEYVGGWTLRLPKWLIDTNGHDLVRIVQPVVNKLCQDEGRPICLPSADPFKRIVEIQTVCLPQIISGDLLRLFQKFQSSRC